MNTRPVVTKFYLKREIKKVNRALHSENAVLHCVAAMRRNKYASSIAEIIDERNHELHAIITRNIKGVITIVYHREFDKQGRIT